jgi:peptidyl-prolyl cis-trans isomerase A (cyclophilin A)
MTPVDRAPFWPRLLELVALLALTSTTVATTCVPAETSNPAPAAAATGTRGTDAEQVHAPLASDLERYWDRLPLPDVTPSIALPRANFVTTAGTIHCALFPGYAPITLANFIGLATGQHAWRDPRDGRVKHTPFYDGLTFHRVVPGFAIQAGDPLGNGSGGPGYEFPDEIVLPQQGLSFQPGTLAMANKGPNTNGSQFFITEGSPVWLQGQYTIIGYCGDLDVIKKIASVPATTSGRPINPVRILRVTMTRY